MKSSYCILVSLWKALTNIFSFLRLCQSKQSKVYLPEPPFPHAEVHVQSLALVLQILTLQIYQLSTKDFPFGSSWGFGVTPSSEIQGLWVDSSRALPPWLEIDSQFLGLRGWCDTQTTSPCWLSAFRASKKQNLRFHSSQSGVRKISRGASENPN